MILRAEVCNLQSPNNLARPVDGRCTYCCTRVELSHELADLKAIGRLFLTDSDKRCQRWQLLSSDFAFAAQPTRSGRPTRARACATNCHKSVGYWRV